jgi:hypothetical protein
LCRCKNNWLSLVDFFCGPGYEVQHYLAYTITIVTSKQLVIIDRAESKWHRNLVEVFMSHRHLGSYDWIVKYRSCMSSNWEPR